MRESINCLQGMDYSKLGDKINEISFYMEMKRPDTVLLHSAAPRPLLDSVRRSCLDELPGRKEEWEQLTVEIRELNPELKDWNIDNGRMFLQGVYAKLLPQDIYRGYYFSENDGASEFVKQMREKGIYLGFGSQPAKPGEVIRLIGTGKSVVFSKTGEPAERKIIVVK